MQRGNNLKLRGGGLHHVAVEASDFDRSLRFYTEALGFRAVLTFPEEGQTAAMPDAGDATYIEIFSGGSGEEPKGSITASVGSLVMVPPATRALSVAASQSPVRTARWTLEDDPPVLARYSFREGPDDEQIELLQADAL